MCRCCDYNSSDCAIFQNPLTGEWDIYEDEFVHDKIYINYCPFCGERLKK